MGTTTNLPNGVTNVFEYLGLGTYVAPVPSRLHQWFDDFDLYTAAQWTVTETQGGATQAIVAGGDGGQLALVNTATENDINAIKWVNNTFVLPTNKRWWIAARLKCNEPIESDILFGLVDTMVGLAPADGVYFFKADGGSTFVLSTEDTSVVTSTGASQAIADDTFFTLVAAFDNEANTLTAYLDDSPFGVITDFTNLPTVALAIGVGVAAGDAVAATLTIDWMLAGVER